VIAVTQQEAIHFTVIYEGQEIDVNTYTHEYRNLMVLLNEKIFLENFGECGGQGRCATCIVEITGLNGRSSEMDRNEPYTLEKAGALKPGIRLSCHLKITKDLGNVIITVKEEV
jgi:2Fe-2S ferredoxin